MKKRLGVNIDHVATIRNARGEKYPEPLKAALAAEKYGADSITIHLREDRRHINDYDLKIIKQKLHIPLNLEIAPTEEMFKIAIRHKPKYVCIVSVDSPIYGYHWGNESAAPIVKNIFEHIIIKESIGSKLIYLFYGELR